MSRYTGPRLKVMRALGTELPGLSRKPLGERNYPPGQPGQRPKRKSGFGVQLIEKQKLRFNYGLGEKQIQRLFREAKRDRGPTGDKLLELLERRLDNFVFRAGFAATRPQARQFVTHGHFNVNGQAVNIPSYELKAGDKVTLREKSRKNVFILESIKKRAARGRVPYVSLDEAAFEASYLNEPERGDMPVNVQEQLIVELYSK